MKNLVTWIVRNAVKIVVITAVLGGGAFLLEGISGLNSTRSSMLALGEAADQVEQLHIQIASRITAETRSTVNQSLDGQRRLLADINREIDTLLRKAGSRNQLLVSLALGKGRAQLESQILLEVRRQQKDYLETLIRYTAAAQDVKEAREALECLRRQHVHIYSALRVNREAQEQLHQESFSANWNPLSDDYEEMQALKAAGEELFKANKAAHAAYLSQKAVIERKLLPARPGSFQVDRKPIDTLRTEVTAEIRRLEALQKSSVVGKLADVFAPWLKTAVGLWATALLIPYGLRTLFYWVLAPVATRLPPIRIERSPGETPLPVSSGSAVSVPISVGPEDELLLKSSFLQSSSRTSDTQTQWLLDGRFPVTSLAAGLWALTRVRTRGGEPTTVMVSCQEDALGEVGLVHLPKGSAMVVQPRSLAGLLKPRDTPVRMSRRWRLNSLHAWMTFQLRYLIFHGPCTLVLTGCRGIRTEVPSASAPRLIRQSATLAFSTNLGYQTRRHATFFPYLRGQEDLFCDLFSGGPGLFVYEEMPYEDRDDRARTSRSASVFDAILKVFGV